MAKAQTDDRRALLAAEMEETADCMRRFIKACRSEGMTWEEIGKCSKLPAWVIRVIAGDIRQNRVAPEYNDRVAKR